MSALVLDERGDPCPIGVPGELVLLGPGLGRGYWRRDDLTAKAFVPCAALGGQRMYRTGDLALWEEDGEVRFLGRIDAQLKLNGFRVEPHEIERTILSHPAVKDAAISAHRLGSGATFVSAFVVPRTTTELETKNLLGKGLRAFLAERLPEHMIPNRFFAIAELPRLGNDKVDLLALKERVTEADSQEYVAPADDIERQIAAVWGSVLGRDKVTTQTPFRELGGDSLMLIRIYAQLSRCFPNVLKVQDLFDHRTVQELAAVVRERTAPKTETPALNVLKF
jgi:acyl carrier protein